MKRLFFFDAGVAGGGPDDCVAGCHHDQDIRMLRVAQLRQGLDEPYGYGAAARAPIYTAD